MEFRSLASARVEDVVLSEEVTPALHRLFRFNLLHAHVHLEDFCVAFFTVYGFCDDQSPIGRDQRQMTTAASNFQPLQSLQSLRLQRNG